MDLGHFLIEKVDNSKLCMTHKQTVRQVQSVRIQIIRRRTVQVAHSLMLEFPKLRQLATLSPLPGFRTWVETQISQQQSREQVSVDVIKGFLPLSH